MSLLAKSANSRPPLLKLRQFQKFQTSPLNELEFIGESQRDSKLNSVGLKLAQADHSLSKSDNFYLSAKSSWFFA
jgi:hypothetical protein